MKRKIGIALGLMFLALAFSGCVQVQEPTEKPSEQAELELAMIKTECINLCLEKLILEEDLSNGPCIGDPMEDYPNWVCDVAHFPRANVDNLRENQCDAWHSGQAKHFIEVTPECQFIKAV